MSLALTQSKTALGLNCKAYFLASGGTPPYSYSVVAGGAGGSIDSGTGLYTAPALVNSDPKKLYDTIRARDAASKSKTASILVGDAFVLFCEIIQHEMGLPVGRAFMWDQKIFQPTDSSLYVAISIASEKPFSNISQPLAGNWTTLEQIINTAALLDIDLMSRGPEARNRKEELLMALNSIYAQQQQEANGFSIGKLPYGNRFVNLSQIDGAAIPYRFKISVNLQYAVTKTKAAQYMDTFQEAAETIEA
jgi:hypothetical protein